MTTRNPQMSHFGGNIPLILAVVLASGCTVRSTDPYLPEICWIDGTYTFSGRQLKRMEENPLDQQRFVQYLEAKWPMEKIKEFCMPENRLPPGYQNLVPWKWAFKELGIHQQAKHGFDKIYVYVSEDDGKNCSYYGEAGTQWHRWTYSLNISRGDDHWVIIEDLPNDFMERKRQE